MSELTMDQMQDLAIRYVAVWNETDTDRRWQTIATLFSDDIAHFTKSQEAHGHNGMALRIKGSHDKWVRDGGALFRVRGEASGHHDVVRFGWEMVPAAGGAALAAGSDVVMLAEDGRIRLDHQFNEPV